MKRVLFVGENPLGTSGCSNMLAGILSQLDTDKYLPACFVVNEVNPAPVLFEPLPFTMVNGTNATDYWGNQRLVALLQDAQFDYLCMVGIDWWRYLPAWNAIKQLREIKKFKWIGIFPYDLWFVSSDFVKHFNDLDYPCVYSEYGRNALAPYVPGIRYFRPPLHLSDSFTPFDSQGKADARSELFPSVSKDSFIFGFVGKNQLRKSPERIVKGFMEAKRVNPNLVLYLHTDLNGVFNLKQIAQDSGAQNGDLVMKQQAFDYARNKMPVVYNAIDCLANCSMQEGLSLTPLEAMACGVPVIGTRTTAQTELLDGVSPLIECKELAYVPMSGAEGSLSMESRACSVEDITMNMLLVAEDATLRNSMIVSGLDRAKAWFAQVDDINGLLDEAGEKPLVESKIDGVLFAQHSSAGDVLMTTQCFKGIVEKHPGMKLTYMTQKVFSGIVEGNPYIDEIVSWDERLLKKYSVVYNPHGDHILHGGFNTLDVTLYSMYPYFCGVEPDDIFIDCLRPTVDLPEEYIVVHTSGGSKKYRTYEHMNLVLKNIEIPVVQLGGAADARCRSDFDLCGKLSWQESAWVMKHAKAAVVVDSFLSHLAGAVGTNAVVLYGPAPPRVVGPKAQGCEIVNLSPDMLKVCKAMGHCWGRTTQCNSPCINTITPSVVKKALVNLLEGKTK